MKPRKEIIEWLAEPADRIEREWPEWMRQMRRQSLNAERWLREREAMAKDIANVP